MGIPSLTKKRLAGAWRPGASPRGNPLLDYARARLACWVLLGVSLTWHLKPDTWHLRFRIPSLTKKRLRLALSYPIDHTLGLVGIRSLTKKRLRHGVVCIQRKRLNLRESVR